MNSTQSNSDTAPALSEQILDQANTGELQDSTPEEISNGHRYLQNEVYYQMLKPTIIALANNPTDRRNEAAVKECQQIVDAMGWEEDSE